MARRKYLFGFCGLSENQKKISTNFTTTNHNVLEQSVVRRIACLLAGLPLGEAVSLQEVSEEHFVMEVDAVIRIGQLSDHDVDHCNDD